MGAVKRTHPISRELQQLRKSLRKLTYELRCGQPSMVSKDEVVFGRGSFKVVFRLGGEDEDRG